MGNAFSLGVDAWDPTHRFETSWVLPPYALFAFRAAFSVYAFATRFVVLGWRCSRAAEGPGSECRDDFSYFTNLTFWGWAFYFFFAALHTFTYAHTGTPLLARWPRFLQALHSLFYTTVVVFAPIVTAVYWALLFSGRGFVSPFDAWSNITQHGMNTGFAFFEIFATRTGLPPWIHMLWLIVLLALYLGLAYLTWGIRGFFVYSFLDPGKQGKLLAAYIGGIAVGCLVIYLVVKGLIALRLWLTERVMHMEGKFARRGTTWRREDVEMARYHK